VLQRTVAAGRAGVITRLGQVVDVGDGLLSPHTYARDHPLRP